MKLLPADIPDMWGRTVNYNTRILLTGTADACARIYDNAVRVTNTVAAADTGTTLVVDTPPTTTTEHMEHTDDSTCS